MGNAFGFRWIDAEDPRYWRSGLPTRYTSAEFIAEFDLATRVLAQLPDGYRFVFLADLSQVRRSEPKNRERVAQFLRECESEIRCHMIAWGIIVTSPLLQGAVQAVSWLGTFPVPTQVFSSIEPCEHWPEQRLAIEELAAEARHS